MALCLSCKKEQADPKLGGSLCTKCYERIVLPSFRVNQAKKKGAGDKT